MKLHSILVYFSEEKADLSLITVRGWSGKKPEHQACCATELRETVWGKSVPHQDVSHLGPVAQMELAPGRVGSVPMVTTKSRECQPASQEPGAGVHFSFSLPFLPSLPWRDTHSALSLAGPSLAAYSSPRPIASVHCSPHTTSPCCSLASSSVGGGGKHSRTGTVSAPPASPLQPPRHLRSFPRLTASGASSEAPPCAPCVGSALGSGLSSCSVSPPSAPSCVGVGAGSLCTPSP